MRITVIFAKNFLIIFKKILKILFMSEMLNFFCLFMMFKMSFLIICRNDFIACSYLKFFISFKSVCNFSEKKLQHSMFAFFCVVRTVHYLKQLLSSIIVSEQQCSLSDISFVVVLEQQHLDSLYVSAVVLE